MARRRPTLVDQVREQLMELISGDSLSVGDRLPNEQEMSERFEVSRATVRDAYRALIDMGYLLRKHGTGTFLVRVPQRHALDLNLSYTAMIQAAGFTPSIRVVSQASEVASPENCRRLRLDADDEIIVVERVRFADDRPVVYSIDRLPSKLVPQHMRGELGPSLFDLLEGAQHGARNGRAQLMPVLATDKESGQLLVPVGSPLLFFDETDYDQAGLPVLLSAEWHTSDVFEMWVNRRALAH